MTLRNFSQRGNWDIGRHGEIGPFALVRGETREQRCETSVLLHAPIIHIRLQNASHKWIPISVRLFRMKIMVLREILAANLKNRMDERHMKQGDLALRAGVAQSHISRLSRMESGATIDILASVSEALGCQPWELLIDDDAVRREAVERMLGPRPPIPLPPAPPKRVAHKRRPRPKASR